MQHKKMYHRAVLYYALVIMSILSHFLSFVGLDSHRSHKALLYG